ncbi:hypothetical protein LMG28688_00789 [Paraburkholderia caffeinitolerans]|uniref:Uncharacterized protein n=2 Tax=Paraburkholderia caffeinitolerans TaxID=1723730 RepID=A0A6J5FJZ2_9BURK|nr:hypothetical protein [Paraburkholderia caffeinitolerans]CAB3779281.1 hypothetical protein LMG28688_00789 [Paraburkholderia caffeinitolerans]
MEHLSCTTALNNEAARIAIRESAARAQAGVFAPVLATETVLAPRIGGFTELIANARASAAHGVAIAKSCRYFNDTHASHAVADAERIATLVEHQISAIESLPEIIALLADLATEPERRRANFPHEVRPEWIALLSGRAATILRRIQR